MAEELPANITLLLPSMSAPERLQTPHIVVPVEYPDMEPYHVCLGRFMDEWGKLELQLRLLFQRLLGADHGRAEALSASMSGKALTEALIALSELSLSPVSYKSFVNLMEQLSGLNQKRNYIVHGYWAAEIIVFNQRNGDVSFKMKVLREYPPTSSRAQQALANPRNQRDRTKYLFQTKRIDQIAQSVTRFRGTLAAFEQVAMPVQAPAAG